MSLRDLGNTVSWWRCVRGQVASAVGSSSRLPSGDFEESDPVLLEVGGHRPSSTPDDGPETSRIDVGRGRGGAPRVVVSSLQKIASRIAKISTK